MKVFTVTIVTNTCGEAYERTLIFSSLEKVHEWKNSYRTVLIPYSDFISGEQYYYHDEEHAFVREVEVDTNEIISEVEDFDIEELFPEC